MCSLSNSQAVMQARKSALSDATNIRQGRNLNHDEKALFCIISQDGPEIKEEHHAERMEAEANRS